MESNPVAFFRRRPLSIAMPLLYALAIASLLAFGVERASSAAKPIDQYCSPTGDYCTTIKLTGKGAIVLGIATFSFFGAYDIKDNVRWAKEFPTGNGLSHKVTWLLDGNKLGNPLKFRP